MVTTVATFRGSGTYRANHQIETTKTPLKPALDTPKCAVNTTTMWPFLTAITSQFQQTKKKASLIMTRYEWKTIAQWPRPNVVSGKKKIVSFIIRWKSFVPTNGDAKKRERLENPGGGSTRFMDEEHALRDVLGTYKNSSENREEGQCSSRGINKWKGRNKPNKLQKKKEKEKKKKRKELCRIWCVETGGQGARRRRKGPNPLPDN